MAGWQRPTEGQEAGQDLLVTGGPLGLEGPSGRPPGEFRHKVGFRSGDRGRLPLGNQLPTCVG